jgi:nitrate/nitrite-specific signal transduction histidine kinase
MNAAQSLEALYQILQNLTGPADAKATLSNILFNILTELQDEGVPVTAETIERKLAETADDFIETTKAKT